MARHSNGKRRQMLALLGLNQRRRRDHLVGSSWCEALGGEYVERRYATRPALGTYPSPTASASKNTLAALDGIILG